jgi:transmembrane sensor
MSAQDQGPQQRHAWDSLSTLKENPTVQEWLRQIDHAGPSTRKPVRRFLAAIAASAIAAVAVGTTVYLHFASPQYETQVGEQRDVLLPDGSRMTLNTNTLVRLRYSKDRRRIELERGEALFFVKHDTERPFDVFAGGTLTRALGTQFNVDMRHSNVTVSVLEGVVQVAAMSAETVTPDARVDQEQPSMTTIRPALSKGEAVEVRPLERRVVTEKANLRRIDAWRTRRLEFSDTPLLEAVEEFNRYSVTRVVVGTKQLETVRVSGVFNIADADGFLFSLQEALHIQILTSAGVITLVTPAPNSHTDISSTL